MSKIKNNNSKGAEEIVLIQIKQDFFTPAEAVSQYLDLIEKSFQKNNIPADDEIFQIKDASKKLIEMYNNYFEENTRENKSKKKSNEYSEIRHNLRTPLNAIIGYSEIIIEDFEDDLSKRALEDLNTIIDLAREIEKAIEKFVIYINKSWSYSFSERLLRKFGKYIFRFFNIMYFNFLRY